MKRILITLAIIGGLLIISFLGLMGFTRAIYKSNSCHQFNIDNIELRAHIDIPGISNSKCVITGRKSEKAKTSFFIIHSNVNIDDYITKNNFKPTEIEQYRSMISPYHLKQEIPDFPAEGNFLSNTGSQKDHNWTAILEKNSGQLWVQINYTD